MIAPAALEISLDNTLYLPALKELGTACSTLCDPKFTTPDRTSVSSVLAEYENQMLAIENLLSLYKKLVEKDSLVLKEMNDEITKADESYSAGFTPLSPLAPIGG